MTKRRSLTVIANATLLTGALGCSDLFGPSRFCLLYAAYPVRVTVLDAETGLGIAAGATLILRDAEYADSLVVPTDPPGWNDMELAVPSSMERKGNYTVTVRRSGYRDWTKSNVIVTADACHVRPRTLTARLVAD